MHTVVVVDLTGQAHPFRVHEDAYETLRAYLDHARSRLGDDLDAAEVLADIERSIGDRLGSLPDAVDRVFSRADVSAVLDAVGAVEAPSPIGASAAASEPPAPRRRPRNRRLYRIHENQALGGVCTGLATYADVDLDVVRWIVALLTVFTFGGFALVYLVLMFVLPVVDTRAEWLALMDQTSEPRTV
jgi:phage shock protein PspC (stress-responsive transcriptional regulator)